MSPLYQFEVPNNADWVQQITLNSYNPATNQRAPYDLTGVEVKMELVGENSGIPSLLLSTINNYIVIPSSGDLGEFLIQVPASVMWTFPGGVYHGDCLLILPSGSVVFAFNVQLTLDAGTTPPSP